MYRVSVRIEVRSHGLDLICVLHWLVHNANHSNVSHIVISMDLIRQPTQECCPTVILIVDIESRAWSILIELLVSNFTRP